MNGGYGALANKHFSFFNADVAEAITCSGQLSIRWAEKGINEYLNKLFKTDIDRVISIDTDSLYIDMEDIVNTFKGDKEDHQAVTDYLDKVMKKKIEPKIADIYTELFGYMNCYTNNMEMDREIISSAAIWTAKKRYCMVVLDNEGVRYEKPHTKIMGLDAKRVVYPIKCRKKLEEAYIVCMTGDNAKLHALIDGFRDDFMQQSIEETSMPRGVSEIDKFHIKDDQYEKGTPMHVKAAIMYNHMVSKKRLGKKYQKIKGGDKIRFIALKEMNPLGAEYIAFFDKLPPEFELDEYVDYELMFNKCFIKPLENVTNCINWNTKFVQTLESFF